MAAGRRLSRVLLVDDNPLFRKIAKRTLTKDARHAVAASCRAEALDIVQRETVELVVIDLVLRGESGIDVLKDVKRHRPDAIVVVISGMFSASSVRRAYRAGAFDCVEKPFLWADLLRDIEHGAGYIEREVDEIPTFEQLRWEYYNRLVEAHGGNVTKAAERAGILRTSLQRIRRKPPTKKSTRRGVSRLPTTSR